MDESVYRPFFKKRWPRNHQELQSYNCFCTSCKDFLCPVSKSYPTWNWESSKEIFKKKISEKSINNFSDFDYSSKYQESTCKRSWGNTLVFRFIKGIWFYTLRKDEANATSIWLSTPPKKKLLLLHYEDTLDQSAGPVGYTDCISAKGVSLLQRESWIWRGSSRAETLGNAEYPFIAIALRSTLVASDRVLSMG